MDFPRLSEIKKIRERVEWSQTELAERANVSQSSIPKYESGKQIPSYEIATRIFKVLIEEDFRMDPEVQEIMTRKIIVAEESSKFSEVLQKMKDNSISQIPIVKSKTIIGTISESLILELVNTFHNMSSLKDQMVNEIMSEPLPTVPPSAKIKEVTPLLRRYGAIIVLERGDLSGIVTKADLMDIR